ncbi:MAG: cobyrinate a,c-diamide synthase [Dehalococcoidia bacterium]
MRVLVVAGTTSGVGKTTIATAIMGALARRGLKVQPFKAGPDYIDPSYHTWVSGEPSRNLDSWLLPPRAVAELFVRAMAGKDIAVIEGVMGLYDGRASLSEEGSTAELAKLLGAPVVLVVDASGAARSLAALVMGYKGFDPDLRLGGVILNAVGSPEHFRLCREAIEQGTGTPVLGYMPRRDDLRLPERHLGLVPMVEGGVGREFFDRLIAQAEATLDLERLSVLAGEAAPAVSAPALFPAQRVPAQARIAVARDRAFSFYYQDSLDLLEAWGGELGPFSPREDGALPPEVSGVHLGGGFPELYAEELGANRAMREAIGRAAGGGMPIYAECGGLMYLGRSIRDFQGREYPMAGVIPVSSCLRDHRLSLGYRTVSALSDGPLLRRGETVRGHEFHWSVLDSGSGEVNAYRIVGEKRREGFFTRGVLASYIHLHMGSLPSMSSRFVKSCRSYRESVGGEFRV